MAHFGLQRNRKKIYIQVWHERRILLGFLTLEDGTDRLSRNVRKELPLLAAS